jgi:hypothetical protein
MTLRRELIQKINSILNAYIETGQGYLGEEMPKEVVENLADAILELRAFQRGSEEWKADLREKMSKKSLEAAVIMGKNIEESVEQAMLDDEARSAFERDMSFNPLPWGSSKGWDKLGKFVVTEYEKDSLIFAKYKTWQMNDGKYVAMKNNRIRSHPEEFVSNFPDFLAHTSMYSKKETVETDENNVPKTY